MSLCTPGFVNVYFLDLGFGHTSRVILKHSVSFAHIPEVSFAPNLSSGGFSTTECRAVLQIAGAYV